MRKSQVITLFPEMFAGVFGSSMMWKAQKDGIVSLETVDLRQFGLGPRKQVDDTPYGGGDGMLLMIEPLWRAVKFAKSQDPEARVVLMSPRGRRWRQVERDGDDHAAGGLGAGGEDGEPRDGGRGWLVQCERGCFSAAGHGDGLDGERTGYEDAGGDVWQ